MLPLVRNVGEVMEGQNNPAPDIGLGTAILAGMGATILIAVVLLLLSWVGFAGKSAATAKNPSSAVPNAPAIFDTSTQQSSTVRSVF